MSQVQPQLTPPPLPDAGHHAEADDTADDNAQFYHQLYHGNDASPPPPEDPALPPEAAPGSPEAPSRPPEVRGGYRRTGSNVYQLDDLWQKAPAHHVGKEPRPGRPRPARRPKQAAVKNHYRIGQAIATLFAAIGWLMILAALVVSSVSLLKPALVAQFGVPNVLGGVAGSLFVGLLTVSIGLAARAQFDQTNATFDQRAAAHELVALERARRGAEQY
jgi:hypothetical protein